MQRKFTRTINNIGTLPYSQRLKLLKLTTLAERRLRGDLIETFKIVNKHVDYGGKMFNMSRSGCNIVSKGMLTKDRTIYNLRKGFISNRVISYWNKLPTYVKRSEDVCSFKVNLEKFKCSSKSILGNFWEVSTTVIDKIEHSSYLANKEAHNNYLNENPWAARKNFINLSKTLT